MALSGALDPATKLLTRDAAVRWRRGAAGPDGHLDQEWTAEPGSNYHLYDPSNGTVSSGDLIRLGP